MQRKLKLISGGKLSSWAITPHKKPPEKHKIEKHIYSIRDFFWDMKIETCVARNWKQKIKKKIFFTSLNVILETIIIWWVLYYNTIATNKILVYYRN